jgi:hypothetical protein
MAMTKAGKESSTSMTRMIAVSMPPPASPEKAPMAVPESMEMATIPKPTVTEVREPQMMRDRISRPT